MHTGRRVATLLACLAALLAAPSVAAAASCPGSVDAGELAGAAQLRKLTAKFNSFGPRILGSPAHNKAIAWLAQQARAEGLRVRSRWFKPYGWFPRTRFKHGPGLDIGAAGGIGVTRPGGPTVDVPDAGAVHWSRPTTKRGAGGPLVYL